MGVYDVAECYYSLSLQNFTKVMIFLEFLHPCVTLQTQNSMDFE